MYFIYLLPPLMVLVRDEPELLELEELLEVLVLDLVVVVVEGVELFVDELDELLEMEVLDGVVWLLDAFLITVVVV